MAGKWILACAFLTIVWTLVESLPSSKDKTKHLGNAVLKSTNLRGVKINQNDSCYAEVEGKILNLRPLKSSDGTARFSAEYKGRTYNFNPCLPFNLPYNESVDETHGDGCNQVAFCINQTTNHQHYYYTAGLHDSAVVHGAYNLKTNETMLELVYNGLGSIKKKTSYIRLMCDRERTSVDDALFIVNKDRDNALTAELHHLCCCLDGCLPKKENAAVNIGASAFVVLLVTLIGSWGIV